MVNSNINLMNILFLSNYMIVFYKITCNIDYINKNKVVFMNKIQYSSLAIMKNPYYR